MRIQRWFGRTAVAAVTAAAVLAGTAGVALADPALGFSDFQATAWWATPVQVASDFGVIQGFPNGTFQPNGTITRAQFAAVLDRVAGYPAPATVTSAGFADVAATDWFAADVDALVTAKVIRPADYPGGKFGPNDPISRAQMATWVGRVLAHEGVPLQDLGSLKPIQVVPESTLQLLASKPSVPYSDLQFAGMTLPAKAAGATFPDLPPATPGYKSIMLAAAYGVIGGFPNGTFQPNASATRAQAAKMMSVLVNEIVPTGAALPTTNDLEAVLQGYLGVLTTAEHALPKTGVTPNAVYQALVKGGIARYATKYAITGPGGAVPFGIPVALRQRQPLLQYDIYTVPTCESVFVGARVAELSCVVGVVAHLWSGGVVSATPMDYGYFAYFVHGANGWRVSDTASYWDVPPWFRSAN